MLVLLAIVDDYQILVFLASLSHLWGRRTFHLGDLQWFGQFSSFLHRTVPTHLKSYVLSFLRFFSLLPLPHPASQVFACPHPVSLPPPLPGTLTADPRPTESPTVES